jgi:AraC family transcriptional regulator
MLMAPPIEKNSRQGSRELEYRQHINDVVDYIQGHLHEPLLLEDLASVAGFSIFHFHRIFAAFVCEPARQYVRRMRLVRAAQQLLNTRREVTDLALDAGYSTLQAFSKEFNKMFGVNPTQMRERNQHSLVSTRGQIMPVERSLRSDRMPEIRDLPRRDVYYVRRYGKSGITFFQAAQDAFSVLRKFMDKHNLKEQCIQKVGITPDDIDIVIPEESRFDAGVVFTEGTYVKPEGEVDIQVIQAGRWRVFTQKGPYNILWQTWNTAYRDWLPISGVVLRDVAPYEVVLNDSKVTASVDLLTEIHIPIHEEGNS